MPRKRHQVKTKEATTSKATSSTSNENSSSSKLKSGQSICRGSRKFGEISVETFSANTNENAPVSNNGAGKPLNGQKPHSSEKTANKADMKTINFFSGNPFVEKTVGILHIYKRNDTALKNDVESSMLCIFNVPSLITCQELLQFLSPVSENIAQIRIIRDHEPNHYMECSDKFYDEFNGKAFNSIELDDVCRLVYVDSVETVKDDNLTVDGHTELPTCPVCLERMDESVDGILTILCNHSFHGWRCLARWGDSSCPVCRHVQTPESTLDHKCSECTKTADLWICLICAHIGCGRYAGAHAYSHFETTSHTFSMQVGGERVWDYAGDNYVHRLIQSKTDGKVVEFEPADRHPEDISSDEKTEAIQLEYTCLLTNQLERQRHYFEEKLTKAEEKLTKFEKFASAQIDDLEMQVKRTVDECDSLKRKVDTLCVEKRQLDAKQTQHVAKIQKVQGELNAEKSINEMLRSDQCQWRERVKTLEAKCGDLIDNKKREVDDLQEQIRDLMFHFEAEQKVKDRVQNDEDISKREVEEGHLLVGEVANRKIERKRR